MSENNKLNQMETEKVSGGKGIFPDEVKVIPPDQRATCKCKNCGKEYKEFVPFFSNGETYCQECREKLSEKFRKKLEKN